MVDKSHATWQEELAGVFTGITPQLINTDAHLAECRKLRLPAPVFNILSDRRGMLSLNSLKKLFYLLRPFKTLADGF